MSLFISAKTRCDLVAVESDKNKIQQNDDVIRIAEIKKSILSIDHLVYYNPKTYQSGKR